MKLQFTPWARFKAGKVQEVIDYWLEGVGRETVDTLQEGMSNGPHTGRIRKKKAGGGRHQASVNRTEAEYPAHDTGRLYNSIGVKRTARSVTVGTDAYYAKYLRGGTRYMVRRKMSDTALKEGGPKAAHKSKGWVQWLRKA